MVAGYRSLLDLVHLLLIYCTCRYSASRVTNTNRKLKDTKHRVRDIGVERYSLPFFLNQGIMASSLFKMAQALCMVR